MQTGSIVINGAELHYNEQGQGGAVVFVHGGLGDFRTWNGQIGPFAERYRAVSYSRRAHYPNAWPPDYTTSSMMVHVEDLARLIEALRLAPAHIVANSYGGYIALFLALRRPDLVRTLALAEPPVYPLLQTLPSGEEMVEEFMSEAWRPAGAAFARGDPEEGVRLFIDGAVAKRGFEALPPHVRRSMMKNAPELAVATRTDYSAQMPPFTCQDAAKIKAPTLLMLGEWSPQAYSYINQELARCIPNVEQATIPRAAHVLHSQNPQAHNQVVLDFLATH